MSGRELILKDIEDKKKKSATLGTMNLVGFGVVGGLTAVGVSSPAGPVILGLSVAVTFVLRQYALVKELSEALISIQLELDRMLIIYNVMEEISKENNIELNNQDLNKWLKKILNYILSIIPKDGLSALTSSRSKGFNLSKISNIEINNSSKPNLMKRIGTWFAPQDYVTILMTDFTRVIGAFTILTSEFNILLLSKEDGVKRKWIDSDAFKLLLQRSSSKIKNVEDKAVTNESRVILEEVVGEFKMYTNPIALLHHKEEEKAKKEKDDEIALHNLLNKSSNERNTRYNNKGAKLNPGKATRKLIGGKKK